MIMYRTTGNFCVEPQNDSLILNKTVSYLISSFIYEHHIQSELQQRTQRCERFDLFTFSRTGFNPVRSQLQTVPTSDRLISE